MKLVHEIGLGHRGAVMKRKQLKLEATNSFGTIKFEQLKKGMENSEELIIMDIFNEGILCKKVTRDFSKTANSGSAIINIEIVDEEKILLEYLSGEDYMEVAEIIKLF